MTTHPGTRARFTLGLSLACTFAFSAPALAVPQITSLSLRGLRIGATTTITVDGSDLLAGPRLLLPIPVERQVVRPGATASRVQIDVTLPAGVPAGMQPVRVATDRGVSNAVLVGVDDLPQLPFAPQLTSLPVALHGTLGGSEILKTSFVGRKGQRVVVDLEARRLGAVVDPVVELYDPRHVQVAWSPGHPHLAGDARLEAVLPADGTYTVEYHDALYRGGSPGQFRLKVGDLHYADYVYPLGGRRGTRQAFELVGSNLAPDVRLQVVADLIGALGEVPLALPRLPGFVGPTPEVRVGELPEVLESETPASKPQEVTAPVVINGRISRPHEEDRYRLLVQPGTRLRFDLLANRAGSPLDAVLALKNDAGGVYAESDDQPDTVDPGLDFTVPAGVTTLVVAIRDLEGRGGERFVYRLTVAPAGRPDFRLSLFDDRAHVPKAGHAIVRVRAARMGYNGPIRLSVPGLPAGTKVDGAEIPAGATDTLLTLSAPPGAPLAQTLLHVVGESADPKVPLRHAARMPETPLTQRQPWLRGDVALAVTEAGPFQLAWDDGQPALGLGSTFPARVRVQRGPGATGPVRLFLVTSQVPPRTADGKQDDVARTLRLEGMPSVAAGQATGIAPILVPADLPRLPYDLAIRGELLSPDGKTVVAGATTPARRLRAAEPFTVRLLASAVDARSGGGPTGKLAGTVERLPGFDKPVTVTLAGLPPELPAPMVTVPGTTSDFELPVAFPYETKLGPLAGVRLVATSTAGPMGLVKAGEIPVSVRVVKGEPPPPAPPLLRLFEDEPAFVALLTEGDGQATLERTDRYAGAAALRVAGTQRVRAKVPGWGFKIAEKPGPGEFRYLRFAWRKSGGENVMLQLNANGHWGPPRGQSGPAYRYEAGPGENPFKGAAIKLDPHVPADWVVVTRDLFADFGPFTLTGIAFTSGPGDYALFDHLYLARTPEDLKGCPTPVPPGKPLLVFEDQPEFLANLLEGAGTATLDTADRFSGTASAKVTPDQRFNQRLPGLNVRIRENPGPGEYRFLRFAWKKKGGETICLQLNHDGNWGPTADRPGKFRYHAGPGPECYGASIALDNKIPADWVLVTRDLFADFGAFTLTGLALSPVDGEYALFDHIYLGRTVRDFEMAKPKPAAKK